jgi:PAS domain-containing protein
MPADKAPKRRNVKPGMRALEACGDGFWEFDLKDGSAWFNEWFHRKLAWPVETKRTTLGDLEPLLKPAAWKALMSKIRGHLENGFPLDLEFEVRVADGQAERWHIRGSAQRNGAGQPEYLAGSMREIRADARPPDASGLECLRAAFDSLPIAAALLDARAQVIEANRQWREFPAAISTQAAARLRAANSQTAIEFWLDRGPGSDNHPRQFRVRAIAFQHDGSRHLAVTLEDRRSD